jgi:hypothetical protein
MSPSNLKRARSPEDSSSSPVFGTTKKVKTSLLADDDEPDSFDKPYDHFVLCGRGEKTNRWPGNRAFRRVVEANRAQYHAGPRRNKTLIARSIVEAVRNQKPPGLFVRKDKDSGLWIDIGKKEAIKKTSQALREDSKKDKKPPAQGEEEDDDENKDNDDNETNDTGSSYSDGEDSEPEDQQDEDDAKPPALARAHGFHGAHQGGFAGGAVSFHSSERGDSDGATAQELDDNEEDDFYRMIDMCRFSDLAHDADFEPLDLPHEAPMGDFSQSSSKGSEDAPLPTSLVLQTSIDSSIASVVSRDGDSETEDSGFSKSMFQHESIYPAASV